jgi:hypothetical protein
MNPYESLTLKFAVFLLANHLRAAFGDLSEVTVRVCVECRT